MKQNVQYLTFEREGEERKDNGLGLIGIQIPFEP